MKNIYLLRHGESTFNTERRIQGSSDNPLTEHGRKQAHEAAGKLKEIPFNRIVSGSLRRQKDTAEIIGNELMKDIPIEIDERLNEVDYGLLEGKDEREIFCHIFPCSDREESFRQIMKMGTKKLLEETGKQEARGTVEKPEEAYCRFLNCLKDIAERDDRSENILLVTSGAIASLFLQEYEWDIPSGKEYVPANCSAVQIFYSDHPVSFRVL